MSRAFPQRQTAANPMVTSEHALTTSAQTDITGGKPVLRYTIPSSTIVLLETECPSKPTGHPKGPEHPNSNLLS